ncbi:DUF962 domain-containing protein [bacterium]|jgi:uncharacterized membrane protein YGL010W|nr:DUF962 domain-containing protein [bacterium]
METTSLARPQLKKYFKDYDTYHKNPSNRLCHYIGIPLIAVTLLGLLALVGGDASLIRLDAGLLLWLVSLAWYLYLDWKIAVPFGFFTLGMYFLGRAMPVPMLWILFFGGWSLQFFGHYRYEKKSPAFLKNVAHVFVGPLWIFAKFLDYK